MLRVVPASKAHHIRSIVSWCTTFNIFISIYTKVHTTATADLLQYSEIVRGLAAEGGDWSYYDQNFRHARAQDTLSYPWCAISWQLHMAAMSKGRTVISLEQKTSRQPFRKGASQAFKVPKGSCFRFHKGLGCSSTQCSYSHSCYRCSNGTHPAFSCLKRSNTSSDSFARASPKNFKPANSGRPLSAK